MKRAILFLGFVLVCQPSALMAQSTDTLPPVLDVSQSGISPSAIDVTTGPQVVTVRLFVTDDLAGVTFTSPNFPQPGVVFRSPSRNQSRSAISFMFLRVEGDDLAGVWQADVTFPQYLENGAWRVESINLEDKVGNMAALDTATLDSLGFPTTLLVTSIEDITPPNLEGLTFTPDTIDTSVDFQTVTVAMHLTDAVSGVDFSFTPDFLFAVGFTSPVGNFIRVCSQPVLTDGTPQDGTWSSECFFPQYSQAGTWPVGITIWDAAGNTHSVPESDLLSMGLPTGVSLTSTPSDTTLPVLSTFSFSPTFIDTATGPAIVTATAALTDDISGFSAIQVNFKSPSGGERRFLFVSSLVSGTPLDGVFDGSVEFPQFSEAGTWQVEFLFYYDNVFNYEFLDTAAMRARGLPTVLNVILPSLVGDGQIDTGGGTVTDETFGERAQITLPPGAVDGPTDVSIDLLESTLTFPMPTGFSAPGTRFVNISFDPTPSMPFPAPGATVVLPLVDPMPAGTQLTLYRVDPGTGNLVAAISVFGGPVVGTVDPDGLSATFNGVSALSVVVGLIADLEPPVVTPPASITVPATEALGTRGTALPALSLFLAGGSAIDNADPSPTRLSPQVGGVDVGDTTLFGLGTTTVTFRFRDVASNIGTATANVTVILGTPKVSGTIAGKSTPSPGVRTVDLVLTNTGTGHARNVQLTAIQFKTLSGSGTVTLASPSLPLVIGSLNVGAATTFTLTLNVPATVKRFAIAEKGTLEDVSGKGFSFSSAQTVIP